MVQPPRTEVEGVREKVAQALASGGPASSHVHHQVRTLIARTVGQVEPHSTLVANPVQGAMIERRDIVR